MNKKRLITLFIALFIVSICAVVQAGMGDRWSVPDDNLNDIITIPSNPDAEYVEWTNQCTPTGTPDTDTIWTYQRTKGGCENIMAKDDGGYEFQVTGANTFLNQGCDISGSGANGSVATEISTPLEFGRGTYFNLKGGGTFTGGFQSTNVDQKGRLIVLIANQNTILVDSGDAATNLDLGGNGSPCNLNMAAGRPHMFFFDGCRWHLIGHHNDF
jgi:hypothetical protein